MSLPAYRQNTDSILSRDEAEIWIKTVCDSCNRAQICSSRETEACNKIKEKLAIRFEGKSDKPLDNTGKNIQERSSWKSPNDSLEVRMTPYDKKMIINCINTIKHVLRKYPDINNSGIHYITAMTRLKRATDEIEEYANQIGCTIDNGDME